jgi:predicted transcriptional regulator
MDLDKLKESVIDARKSLNNYPQSEKKTHLNLCLVEISKETDKIRGRAATLEKRKNELIFRIKKELS